MGNTITDKEENYIRPSMMEDTAFHGKEAFSAVHACKVAQKGSSRK